MIKKIILIEMNGSEHPMFGKFSINLIFISQILLQLMELSTGVIDYLELFGEAYEDAYWFLLRLKSKHFSENFDVR